MRSPTWLAVSLVILAGAAAGWIAGQPARPQPRDGELRIHAQPFRFERTPTEPKAITVDRWLEVPWLYEDFDLEAQIELGEATTLDFVLRRVEPRELQGVQRQFHGRFTVLRLSTLGAGPPWRSRAAALSGPEGGVGLGPGAATVQIRGRGRVLTANVAGIVLPPVLAQDEHGSLALLVRSGTAAVRSLQIRPVPRAGEPLAVAGGLAALVLAAAGLVLRVPARRLVVAGVLLALAGVLARDIGLAALPPLAEPGGASRWVTALAGVPLAAAVLLRDRARLVFGAIGLLAAAAAMGAAVQTEQARFPRTPELDAMFGPDAGSGIAEALAQRVRGPLGVHVLEPGRRRVMLLGGQLLWRRGAAPDEHVEPLLGGELRGRAGDVEVLSLPTEDGWSAQQWRLFWNCYRGWRPAVLVFGVPRDEAAEDAATGRPRSSPDALAATLREVQAGCAELGARLVLLADAGLPADLRAVLAGVATADVPLVEVGAGTSPLALAQRLGAVVAPLLR
jgi:hypothetical protein